MANVDRRAKMDELREGVTLLRARLLAEFADRVRSVSELDALSEVAALALSADSVHVGRIDRPHGLLRMVRNAGQLAQWEVEAPVDEVYLVADYPQLLHATERAQPWRGAVDDEATAENDRALLAR